MFVRDQAEVEESLRRRRRARRRAMEEKLRADEQSDQACRFLDVCTLKTTQLPDCLRRLQKIPRECLVGRDNTSSPHLEPCPAAVGPLGAVAAEPAL